MTDRDSSFDDWLISDQLGLLSEAERKRLGDALAVDPKLVDRRRRLQRLLEPLDAWNAPPPPANLADRVLSKIAAVDRNEATRIGPELPTGHDRARLFRTPFSMRDLVGLAAVVAFFGVILVPTMSSVRAKSQQTACAVNLAGIGQALSAYASSHDDALPRVAMVPGGNWLRVTNGNGPYSPNSRHVFLLARFRFVSSPTVFVCPSSPDGRAMNVENPFALADFPNPQNCTYDTLNMAGPTPVRSASPRLAFMADANPLFAGGRFRLVDPETHSHNHHRLRGQNVLYLDGAVSWCITPNCGPAHDNIWQAGAVRVYKGTEVQTSKDDTFLVP